MDKVSQIYVHFNFLRAFLKKKYIYVTLFLELFWHLPSIHRKNWQLTEKWNKVFKNGPSKISGTQQLKNHFKYFKSCIREILLGPFVSALFQTCLIIINYMKLMAFIRNKITLYFNLETNYFHKHIIISISTLFYEGIQIFLEPWFS